ncbi:signal peptidase I [Candidatus Latescibacterota bacterium]
MSIENMQLTKFQRFRKEWLEPVIIALILAGIIRSFVIQPFKIPSGSMEDTLLVGDHLMAAKFLYGLKVPFTDKRILKIRDPRQGDIIVFKFPEDPSKDFIKRCVATGGQKVSIKDKVLYVDGVEQHLPSEAKFVDDYIYSDNSRLHGDLCRRDNISEFVVPDNMFFMMGDNRDNSNDSRFWGYVPYKNIVGKALIIYWSWDRTRPFYKSVRWKRFLDLIV